MIGGLLWLVFLLVESWFVGWLDFEVLFGEENGMDSFREEGYCAGFKVGSEFSLVYFIVFL